MKRVRVAVIGLCLSLWSGAALAAPPLGTWVSQDGGVKVRLTDCGKRLCGYVAWLREPIDRHTGAPKTDTLNPDPRKRRTPLIGLKVVNDFVATGRERWSGTIYNADNGRTYHANIIVKDARTLRLEGCLLRLLCLGHTWRRVADVPNLAADQAVRAR